MAKNKFRKLNKTIAICTVLPMLLGSTIVLLPTTKAKAAVQTVQAKRNVMYYGDWSIWGGQGQFYPKDIPAASLTHLNFAFMDFDASGNLAFTDTDAAVGAPVGMPGVQWNAPNAGIINALQELRAENPNLKIGISLGGWSKSGDFSTVTANATTRANFVSNIMKFVNYTNMDFVDIDWEYPCYQRQPDLVDNARDEGTPKATAADKQNYVLLLQDLRAALDKQGKDIGKTYELSVAMPAPKSTLDLGIDIPKVFDAIDFANIMTYDMRGAWDDTSGHQTGLYANPNDPTKGAGLSIDESVNYLKSQGAPSQKIVIGTAYYTRGWEKVSAGPDAKTPGLYGTAAQVTKDADASPARGAKNEAPLTNGDGGRAGGVWSYRNLSALKTAYPGLNEYWDDVAKAPYLYNPSTGAFFTYDNVRSVTEKAKYVNDNNLGGMIGWMASQDKETTGTKRDELTNASKQGLFGTAALPQYSIVSKNLNVTATITPYSEAGVAGGGYQITITNKEAAQESQAVLKAVETAAETIKSPKLYIKSTDGPLTSGDYTAGTVSYANGYTVVDISTVYEAQTLSQGKSYTFKLKAATAPTNTSAIQSVELSQRIYSGAPVEVGRQTVFGSTTVQNTAPVISGVSDKNVVTGAAFDPKAGVTATDKEDGDLTSSIAITGSVNTAVPGAYKLTYTVTDSKGLVTTATATVTVADQVQPVNTAPTISGAVNKTITVGDTFNSLTGVTATDKEDGDLTSKIVVSGTVNTATAGSYNVSYTVTDSKGLATTVQITVTVQAKATGDTYDATKIYNTGDVVTYKGLQYKALWWTQGGTPDTSSNWQRVVTPNADGSVPYTPGTAYSGSVLVSYNGHIYKPNWWTNSIPGSDSSWTLVS